MRSFSFASFDLKINMLLLLAANILSGIVGIVLQNTGVFPLETSHFIFFSFVFFLFALYRPSWAFLLFIGMMPYEIVSLANLAGTVTLRPYQWIGILLLLAVGLRMISKKMSFQIFRPIYADLLPLLIVLGSFLAIIAAPDAQLAFKQSLVLTSFVTLYFLGRIFLRTLQDIRHVVPYLLSSSVVVFGYALWQNVRFMKGENSFEVMAGRPNATFSEADWLGYFALLILVIIWTLLAPFTFDHMKKKSLPAVLVLCEVLTFLALLLAVSRSAWLGALFGFLVFVAIQVFTFWKTKNHKILQRVFLLVGTTIFSFIVALGSISIFHLTPFHLFERGVSTGGLQKITVSCTSDVALPEKIPSTDDLAPYACRHINLEDIAKEKEEGHFIKEIYRNDPNVAIRKSIYAQVVEIILSHPITGIGWGSVATFLGSDERGVGLNASNMFLEFWLGSGGIGFLAFVLWWILLLFVNGRRILRSASTDSFSLFLFGAGIAFTVFNLFNSGMLLGFFFLFLSLGTLSLEQEKISFFGKPLI